MRGCSTDGDGDGDDDDGGDKYDDDNDIDYDDTLGTHYAAFSHDGDDCRYNDGNGDDDGADEMTAANAAMTTAMTVAMVTMMSITTITMTGMTAKTTTEATAVMMPTAMNDCEGKADEGTWRRTRRCQG